MNSANGVRDEGLSSLCLVGEVFPLRPHFEGQYSDFIIAGEQAARKALLQCVFRQRITFYGSSWGVRWDGEGLFKWSANGDLARDSWVIAARARKARLAYREWRGEGFASLVAVLFSVPAAEVVGDLARIFEV